MSATGKSRGERSNDSALKLKILEWIDQLSTHFNQPQDEEQIKIFLHALRSCTVYQVNEAFERCLNECQFMPKLADVHQRMPEQRFPAENPGRFIIREEPILDLVRPIARELYPQLESMEGRELYEAFRHANRVRYERMGIDWRAWGK